MARDKSLEFYDKSVMQSVSPGISTDYIRNIGDVGYESYPPAMYYTYVAGYQPSYNPLNNSGGTVEIQSITLELHVGSSNGDHTVKVGILSSALTDNDHKTNYSRISSVSTVWTLSTGKTHVLKVTDDGQIRNVLQYGIGIVPGSSGDWKAYTSLTAYYTYTDTAEPPKVAITSYPSSSYLNDTVNIGWNYEQSAGVEQYAVDVQLYNAADNFEIPLAEKLVTSEKSCSVKFDSVAIKLASTGVWAYRVRAYTRSGTVVGEWATSPTVTLKNIDIEIVSPKDGENKLAAQATRLQWKKAASDTSANAPYGFSVRYSTNAGESWTTLLAKEKASQANGVWYVEIPANTLPNGIIQWSVFVWTTQHQFGSELRTTFAAVIQASTAAVSCDGKPLPTLSWSSSSQAAYQVRFADYDSGAVYSSAKSHTVPYVYADGLYAVQVRTQATTGEWSAWTDVQYVQITNSSPSGSVSVSAQKTKHAVTLTWTASGTFAGYILYRSGVPVYAGKDKKFADITANGRHTYFVRAVTAAGYYLQSAEITVNTTPDVDCLYDFAGARWISLKYSATPRRRQYTETERVSFRYFAGRAYPVAFTEGFRERTGAFSYCFTTEADAAAVAALAGRTVMYKGKDGSGIYGILGGVSRVSEIIHDVSFTVTQIDREERVPYETA